MAQWKGRRRGVGAETHVSKKRRLRCVTNVAFGVFQDDDESQARSSLNMVIGHGD